MSAPKWSQQARRALSFLFRPLQDVDLFVEDTDDEAFYTELAKRLIHKKRRIERVVALGNRDAVLKHARSTPSGERPTVFLIDGDLSWVRGEAEPLPPRVHRLDAYCIESAIVSESALATILVEELALNESDARRRLAFPEWIQSVQTELADLFAAFAAVSEVQPAPPSVSLALTNFLTTPPDGGIPRLDVEKLRAAKEALLDDAQSRAPQQDVRAAYKSYADRVRQLPWPIHAVSGKDFTLPLVDFHLRQVAKVNVRRVALRMRLARLAEFSDETHPLSRLAAVLSNA